MGKVIKITEYLSKKIRNTSISEKPKEKMEYYEKMNKHITWYKERKTESD